jgi:HNH endonuclease/NUMOD4 motif
MIEWREVAGWPGYEVSSAGDVRRGERIKKQTIAANGYPVVNLTNGVARQKVIPVHRLVCTAFWGTSPPDHEVAHQDGDKLNATADNLRWATSAQNSADMIAHGRTTRGERSTSAKLSEVEVKQIKSRLAKGEAVTEIAPDFPDVGKYAIYGIKWRRTWSWLSAAGVDA